MGNRIVRLAVALLLFGVGASSYAATSPEPDQATLFQQGKQIFRDDTFGDEAFWGDTLKLHEAIEGQSLGGVGPGVSPKAALAVGLKVDVDRLPPPIVRAIRTNAIDLTSPATTLALLRLRSVVGVNGFLKMAAADIYVRSASAARSVIQP